jgi:osmotically-inducible protein OsmY
MRFNRFSQTTIFRAAASIAVLCLLSACSVPGMVIGAGATAGIAAAEERGVATALDDLQIDVEIKRQFLELDENLLAAVSTEVHDGRVLLTGVVDEPEMWMSAARLSWGVDGVSEVINEIKVAGDASIAQASKDIFISTELRARLMGDGDVSAINYSIETVRGTIYLLGIARSESELQRVINHARNVSGVRNIVPYVRVKPPEQDQPV